jgi:hypothetical protein
MYISGGHASDLFYELFKLNLFTFEWTRISPKRSTLKRTRYLHYTTVLGSKMYLKEPDREFLYAFDFEKETWETASTSSPFGTRELIPYDGAIYAWESSLDLSFNVHKFDGTKWEQYETTGNKPTASNFSAVAIDGSSAYCMFSSNTTSKRFVYIFELNVKTKTWNQVYVQGSTIPRGLLFSACVAVNNKIYTHGGYLSGDYLNDFYCFDLFTRRWSKVGDVQSMPKFAGHSIITWNSKFIIFGGYNSGTYYGDVWICDLQEDKLQQKLNLLLKHPKLVDVIFNVRMVY